MPIQNFSGKCFVAFTDISGFKVMMADGNKAIQAMDKFYSSGYRALQQESQKVNGIFISDCGVVFSTNGTKEQQLSNLLRVIKTINSSLLEDDIMLTTSICWGQFKYENKLVFEGIEKQPVYGNAYLSAFLDNETGKPKLEPGYCRVVKENLGDINMADIEQSAFIIETNQHHLYYWMCDDENDISNFESKYKDSYNLKFSGMLNALKSNNS